MVAGETCQTGSMLYLLIAFFIAASSRPCSDADRSLDVWNEVPPFETSSKSSLALSDRMLTSIPAC